jgi:hypothetical protein
LSDAIISPGFPSQYFSIEWIGKLRAPTSEIYRLSVEAYNHSQVELIVNGQRRLVYNDFTGKGTTEAMYVDLEFI